MNGTHTTLLRLGRLTAAIALILALIGLTTPTARAASLTVTSTADGGAGSLRQAIADAASGDTITFNLSGCPCTITLGGQLVIDKNLTITGPGDSNLTISGNNAVRIFQVNAGGTLNLSGVTVANGIATGDGWGGGIQNNGGTLAVSGSSFSGNTSDRFGAAIYNNGGTLTVSDSSFSGNSASGLGGAILSIFGTLAVSGSSFSGNTSDIFGGAIYASAGTLVVSSSSFISNSSSIEGGGIYADDGAVTISNSTFTGNTASTEGGGIYASGGTVTISNSTFDGNTASTEGGGIYASSQQLSLSNTTLTNNRPGGNCGGFISFASDKGGNRTDDRTCDFSSVPTDISLDPSSVAEEQPAGTTVGTFSTDATGGSYIYVLVSGEGDTDNGSFTINQDTLETAASFDYEDKTSYSIRVQLTDDLGLTVVKNFTVSVTDVVENAAPVASNDIASTDEDTSVIITVLANDSDTDGDALTPSIVGGPSNGQATVNPNGTITYTPNANYNGSDSFTYKTNDATTDSNVATVDITVNAVNDAPPITQGSATSVTMSEDGNPTPFGLTLNATDAEGDTLTWSISTPAANGTASASGSGSSKAIGYTPNANFNGSDSFVVHISDGNGGTDTISVNVTVLPVNDAPTATGDSYSTDEDTPLMGNALSNDSDVDATPLTAVKVSNPVHGTLTLNNDGSFTYTPAANYSGLDSFTYKANDGTADSNVVTVTITVNAVNDAPTIAVAAGGQCLSDASGRINLALSDLDSSNLTLRRSSSNTTIVPVNNVVLAGSGANRTATITTANGKTGTATITITVSDGQASSSVTVRVAAGGNGNDTITGSDGADLIVGQNGDDMLSGKAGNDVLCGGLGNDMLSGGADADSFDGGKGTDRVTDFTRSEGDIQLNIP